jgi:hypothetical protein
LWHGNQILSDVYQNYDLGLKFHRYKHTLRKILNAFDHSFEESAEESAIGNEAKRIFAQAAAGVTPVALFRLGG